MPKVIDGNKDNATNSMNDDTKDNQTSATTTTNPTPPVFAAKKPGESFTAADHEFLSKNENFRYSPNSKKGKVGHAIIKKDDNGDKTAFQFAIPAEANGEAPQVRPLEKVEEIQRFGRTRYRARTPGGTVMYARRYEHATIGTEESAEEVDIGYFSPSEKDDGEPFWGGQDIEKPLFNEPTEDHVDEMKEIGVRTKGGNELVVDPASVWHREMNKKRTPDQNTLMGESAKDAYEGFMDQMTDELTPEAKEIFKRAVDAPLRHAFYGNYRPEWLHAEGFSLTPMNKDPQRRDNLGSAPKWANTEMMVLERVAKWFAFNRPESYISIKPLFQMVLDSEIIKKIDFDVTLKKNDKFIRFHQTINPIQKYPLFRKATDLSQATAIADNFLHDVTPASSQKVIKNGQAVAADVANASTSSKASSTTMMTSQLGSKPAQAKPAKDVANASTAVKTAQPAPTQSNIDSFLKPAATAKKPSSTAQIMDKTPSLSSAASLLKAGHESSSTKTTSSSTLPKGSSMLKPSSKAAKSDKADMMKDSSDSSVEAVRKASKSARKQQLPTHFKYEKSLVQISTTSFEAEYDEPWLGSHVQSCSGTGLVIEHNNKKYILTNAHVVENSVMLRVRLANHKETFEASKKCVSYQCDLALLEVSDTKKVNGYSFSELAEPLELGEMAHLQDRVQTVGFPMGGDEISISKGITSRIEVRDYCMSGLDMLQIQIDAAVNPGNSGGPVFSNDKVVGVAFQGYDRQGLGYMIPIPIIKHFLQEAFSGKPYRGFPILPVSFQPLINETLRKHYGMKSNQTGIRISKIDNLTDAKNKLQPNDILLEIDGLEVANEGTVSIPGIGNCIDLIHVTHMKFIGDSVNLKILRKNAATSQWETQNIDVVLDHVPLETKRVPQNEFDKMPTYFIASGISFTPLTRNYIDGKGSIFEESYMGESLMDMSKKTPNEQVVVINEIFDSAETEGYEGYENSIVKTVNGKEINNIHDVIAAIEGNQTDTHTITTSENVIAVKNMGPVEHRALLKRYNIKQDRSDDLVPQAVRVEQVASFATPMSPELAGDDSPRPIRTKRRSKPVVETVDDDEEDEDDSDFDNDNQADDVDDARWNKMLSSGMMPGKARFLNTLAHLEDKYKDLDEDDDEGISLGDDTGSDEHSDETTNEIDNESSTEEDKKPVKRRLVKRSEASFFNNKKKRDDSDEEEDHQVKKSRRR